MNLFLSQASIVFSGSDDTHLNAFFALKKATRLSD